MAPERHALVAGIRVDPLTYDEAVDVVASAAAARTSSYVCVANVHMVMEANDDPDFAGVLREALAVTPDGMPLVWMLRALGHETSRVYGPELTLRVCDRAEWDGLSVALYGGTEESLEDFTDFLHERNPGLHIATRIAPPFRALTDEEDAAYTEKIRASGAHIVFVGIGCPRQEWWMARHRGRIDAVMLGVGAAFDFHSGRVRQAPPTVQKLGMEWAFRLAMEPRRLARRYLKHNPRFAARALRQLTRGT
ncbi:MAG: WecB/TagA/CpsF family glycosyltransferase [Rhodothermales bacterium]|nr:WecB/TagA/CpsF family glycosyltransferase [Rhodothermales bacterium]MBO6779559.1 WecB/TagA/CpsF family glycosyltransferase [Rhodothermales bacterium]